MEDVVNFIFVISCVIAKAFICCSYHIAFGSRNEDIQQLASIRPTTSVPAPSVPL